jgi:hypothetical protein
MKYLKTAFVTVISLAGCADAGPKQAPSEQQHAAVEAIQVSEPHDHRLIVEWETFDDLAGLVAGTEVRGHVVGQASAHRPRPDLAGASLTAEQAEEVLFTPETDSQLVVDEVIQSTSRATGLDGAALAVGSTIAVRELGGVGPDGCVVELTDKPRMRVGDDLLLFLNAAGPGRFHAGGYQNRFTVRDGTLEPLASVVHPGGALDVYRGRLPAELTAEVRRLAR